MNGLRVAVEKDLRILMIEKLDELACSPESQTYPGLHKNKYGQQVEGGDSTPLLYCREIPSVVLSLALEPLAQERREPARAPPKESHENDQRFGTILLWREAETLAVDQPAEEQAAGIPYFSLSVYKGGL